MQKRSLNFRRVKFPTQRALPFRYTARQPEPLPAAPVGAGPTRTSAAGGVPEERQTSGQGEKHPNACYANGVLVHIHTTGLVHFQFTVVSSFLLEIGFAEQN